MSSLTNLRDRVFSEEESRSTRSFDLLQPGSPYLSTFHIRVLPVLINEGVVIPHYLLWLCLRNNDTDVIIAIEKLLTSKSFHSQGYPFGDICVKAMITAWSALDARIHIPDLLAMILSYVCDVKDVMSVESMTMPIAWDEDDNDDT